MPAIPNPPPKIVRIPDTFDTVIQKDQLREYEKRHYPIVRLARLNRIKTLVDDLYNESSARRFHDPVEIHSYVEHKPPKKLLIKFGLDQKRDVFFQITTMALEDIGVLENNDTFLIGDTIHWGDDVYEIKDQSRDTEAYWENTNIPFYLVLAGDYYRDGE